MSNLDVSLTLKLISQLKGPAEEAKRDLAGVKQAAEALGKSGGPGSRLETEFKKIETSAKNAQMSMRGMANASFGGAVGGVSSLSAAYDKLSSKAHFARSATARSMDGVASGARKAKKELGEVEKAIEALDKKIMNMAATAYVGRQIKEIADRLRKPIETAIDKAEQFEADNFSIANAAGKIGDRKAIGESLLDTSKRANVKTDEIRKGRRKLVELGGAEYLAELRKDGREVDLARLTKISEADPADIYKLYAEARKSKLSPAKALDKIFRMWAGGKIGSFELKDLGHFMPQLAQTGIQFGQTPEQAWTSIPAILQTFRESSGEPGVAATWMKHILGQLDAPAYKKRFKKELGLDIDKTRSAAMKAGKDPVLVVLDEIANRIQAKEKQLGSAAGTVSKPEDGGEGHIVRADPKKAGSIMRDYNIRAGVNAYVMKRAELQQFLDTDNARKEAGEAWEQQRQTTRGAREAMEISQNEAAVRAGQTQLKSQKSAYERRRGWADTGAAFAKDHPGVTSIGMGAANWGTTIGGWVGSGIQISAGIAGAALVGEKILTKYPWLGRAAGAAADAAGVPAAAAKGFGEGVVKAVEEAATKSPGVAGRLGAIGAAATGLTVVQGTLHAANIMAGNPLDSGLTPEEAARKARRRRALEAEHNPGGSSRAQDDRLKAELDRHRASMTAAKGAADKVADASKVDLKPAGAQAMQSYAAGLQAQGAAAVGAAAAIVEKLKAMLNTTFTPTIAPRLTAPASAAPAKSATPGKQSRLGGQHFHGDMHFHGVRDMDGVNRHLAALQGRQARDRRDGALHDISVGGYA